MAERTGVFRRARAARPGLVLFRRWPLIFVLIGANAILLYFLNNVFGFEPFAERFVGGDFGALVDRLTVPDAGRLLAHLAGLAIAISLAGFFTAARYSCGCERPGDQG